MTPSCFACGSRAEDGHHPTGRGFDGRYLDPWFRTGLCHDDHELAHDDLRTAGLELARSGVGFLDSLELTLRRLGTFLGRLPTAGTGELLRSLARWCSEKADGLKTVIAALDLALPDWRLLPGMP